MQPTQLSNTGQAPIEAVGDSDPQAMAQVPNSPLGQQPQPAPQSTQQSLRALIEKTNIAEDLDEKQINTIASEAREGFESDLESRKEWETNIDEWTKLAIQCKEEKTFPWSGASNVKYPLLATAAMQFSARAYPSLIPSDGKVVKTQVIGKDLTGKKTELASRVSTFMSWQIMDDMEGWEEDMDKLLIMLPILGTMFKKTYWNPITEKNCSKLIMPKDLVVNYHTKTLCDSERVSEIIYLSKRKFKEKQLSGIYLDVDLGEPQSDEGATDSTTPYQFIVQQTYIDLDDDGYAEPYVVTFERYTGKLVRISARFDEKSIKTDKDGKITSITALEYYTKFGFIPNPDGGFYDIGFGMLLGPINESVNTLINQLIDAGTLNNMQSGFIGKGLRIRMGDQRFQLGEWKAVNATGDDLKKQILPLPTKEPSAVLFQLMGSLITSGKELASVAEIFVGKMPGQNTPATTTMATIEQGMKVFTAVYKRIYRSLAEEFDKLFDLNATYLDPETYVNVLDISVGPGDFDDSNYDIKPGADPTAVSQTEKLLKAQGLLELLPSGVLDPIKVIQRVLDAQEQPNAMDLFSPTAGQPKPNPAQQEMEMKMQAEQQKSQIQGQQIQFKQAMDQRDQQFKQTMSAQQQDHDLQFAQMKNTLEASALLHKNRIREVQAGQQLQNTQAVHDQKMTNMKAEATLQSKNSTSGGKKK